MVLKKTEFVVAGILQYYKFSIPAREGLFLHICILSRFLNAVIRTNTTMVEVRLYIFKIIGMPDLI